MTRRDKPFYESEVASDHATPAAAAPGAGRLDVVEMWTRNWWYYSGSKNSNSVMRTSPDDHGVGVEKIVRSTSAQEYYCCYWYSFRRLVNWS